MCHLHLSNGDICGLNNPVSRMIWQNGSWKYNHWAFNGAIPVWPNKEGSIHNNHCDVANGFHSPSMHGARKMTRKQIQAIAQGTGGKAMPWSYVRNSELKIVDVVYKGEISASDLRESTSEFIVLEKREALNRFLIDADEMSLAPNTSLFDVLDLPAKQYVEEEADRAGRVAVYLSASSKAQDTVQFYETACTNRGWMVKVFRGRQEALR